MSKIDLDKYYTSSELAKYCVNKTFEILGNDWNRIIEPSCGEGVFLQYLPETTISYDIEPILDKTIKADYRLVKLPYEDKSLVIGNPPFGRANKTSVQFIKASLQHSPYISFIQPISQLDNNRTMKDTELIHSEDLDIQEFSGHKLKTCLNIYHYLPNGHKLQNYDIEGVEVRHIFRTGSKKHSDAILNDNYDFRIAAWAILDY